MTAAAAIWTVYFSAIGIAGVVLAALWLRPGPKLALKTIAAVGAGGLTIVPWLLVASAQFRHQNEGFWIDPLNVMEILGTAGQLLSGPQIPDGVAFGSVAVAMQAVVIGIWALALGSLIGYRAQLDGRARRGLTFGLIACSGVGILVVVSIVRPTLDARYASLMWMPMLALAGVGLSLLPRRGASVLVGLVAAASLAISLPITHNEVRDLIPELNAGVGPHDLVATTFDEYLILLDESDANVTARLHLLRRDNPHWYVGTAAYPDGAVIHAVPDDVVSSGGRIYWVAPPGVSSPLIPAGYTSRETRCVLLACLTVFER